MSYFSKVSAVVASVFLATAAFAGSPEKDIVDTAVSAGSFNTLVAAVKAAGLVDTLKGAGPFTVFAPTDAAFAKLPPGTVEDLLKPENKAKLQSVLTYHVVSGKVMAKNVVKLSSAKTVNGQQMTVKTGNGSVMVDGARSSRPTSRHKRRIHVTTSDPMSSWGGLGLPHNPDDYAKAA
jgi:uncharacterized surface protein with fasciclin (FAS1) repeats